jgi:hypothetical protein
MKSLPIYIFTTLICFLFSSCSATFKYYLINFLNEPVTVTFHFERNHTSFFNDTNKLAIKFSDEIKQINRKTERQLRQESKAIIIDSNSISFEITPTSTVLLPRGLDFYWYVDSVSFNSSILNRTYTTKELSTLLKNNGSYFSSIREWYEIK